MNQSFNPETLDMVAAALRAEPLTPRQIEQALPHHLNRSTVRTALRQLASAGRALAEGDINQRYYRAKALP